MRENAGKKTLPQETLINITQRMRRAAVSGAHALSPFPRTFTLASAHFTLASTLFTLASALLHNREMKAASEPAQAPGVAIALQPSSRSRIPATWITISSFWRRKLQRASLNGLPSARKCFFFFSE
jgi:hypothetical protein